MIGISLLGSTGSIGKSTLDIISRHTERFRIIALSANRNIDTLFQQCWQYKPLFAVILQPEFAVDLQLKISQAGLKTQVLIGQQGLITVASLPETDYVVAALVGATGLSSTLAAAKNGKRILLANKEALVMSGKLLMDTVKMNNATLLPIDSEHNAIFQCWPKDFLLGQSCPQIEKIILTASGGPFLKRDLNKFATITPQEAWTHPNWNMGKKVSIDSATMMNKVLEVIEAHWLFNIAAKNIEVMLHPQSVVHSLVEFIDGSMLAQLGNPDMRVPISNALAWPERIESGAASLDLIACGNLQFETIDERRYPAIKLAYAALAAGGTASAILNAANEVAVEAFVAEKISFSEIVEICTETLAKVPKLAANCLENIMHSDSEARRVAGEMMAVST